MIIVMQKQTADENIEHVVAELIRRAIDAYKVKP